MNTSFISSSWHAIRYTRNTQDYNAIRNSKLYTEFLKLRNFFCKKRRVHSDEVNKLNKSRINDWYIIIEVVSWTLLSTKYGLMVASIPGIGIKNDSPFFFVTMNTLNIRRSFQVGFFVRQPSNDFVDFVFR